MRKIVINKCYGGFGLSHKAEMEYARRKGITLYPCVDDQDFHHFKPYVEEEKAFLIHYLTKPLKEDGTYEEGTYFCSARDEKRDDPILVKLVEEMGEEADGSHAELKIVEIPSSVDWKIEEYDGIEWIAEAHQTWE